MFPCAEKMSRSRVCRVPIFFSKLSWLFCYITDYFIEATNINFTMTHNFPRFAVVVVTLACFFSCKKNVGKTEESTEQHNMKTIGSIERLDSAINTIVSRQAVLEVIADWYEWSEGPLWIGQHNMLVFSDPPKNTVYKWTEEKGAEVYLTPSGYTGTTPSESKEPGSNGLTLSKDGKLTLCQHGNRQVAIMDAPLDAPNPKFTALAAGYEGKKFNSPNDLTYNSKGDLFFTDPPYGLPKHAEDPAKEIPFQGVYRVTADGTVTLITDSLTRPNGVALTPDEKTLVVANSDPDKAKWYVFDLSENGSASNARVLYDATSFTKTEQGLPDGLKIDKEGNIFASGPGGLWIFNAAGTLLGKFKFPVPISNCALSDDQKTLYITADMYIIRVKLR